MRTQGAPGFEPWVLWGASHAGPMGAGKSAAAGRSGLALALVAGAAAAAALLASPAGEAHGEPGTAAVSYGGVDYAVSYDAVGMSVVSASVDEDFESLLLGVQVGGPGTGTIEVVLERALIDARSRDGSEDVAFIVILDGGDDAAVEEIDTSADARTIKFSLPSGSDEALIVGTVLGGGGGAEEPAGGAPEPAAPGPAEEQEPEPAAPEPDPSPPQEQPGQPDPEPFVEPGTDPVEDYVKRYATEPEYAAWFDENFGGQYGSICEAVGLGAGCVEEYNAAAAAEAAAAAAAAAEQQAQPAPTGPESFVDPSADPYEEYVKRYVGDAEFRAWYDESYPDRQFCDAVGLEAGCVEAYNERVAAAEAEEAAAAAAEAEAAAMQSALEQSCGEGTVLRDGACVALPPPRDPVGSGRELATGLVAAFVIALAAGVMFWIFARAGRRGRRQRRGGDGAGAPDGPAGGEGGPGEAAPPAPARAGGGYDGDDDEPRGRGTIV